MRRRKNPRNGLGRPILSRQRKAQNIEINYFYFCVTLVSRGRVAGGHFLVARSILTTRPSNGSQSVNDQRQILDDLRRGGSLAPSQHETRSSSHGSPGSGSPSLRTDPWYTRVEQDEECSHPACKKAERNFGTQAPMRLPTEREFELVAVTPDGCRDGGSCNKRPR